MKKDEVADGIRFAFLTGWRRGEVFSLTGVSSTGAEVSCDWSPA